MVYVAIVIVIVLLFTSETYGEVQVLILTFVVALVLNQGCLLDTSPRGPCR